VADQTRAAGSTLNRLRRFLTWRRRQSAPLGGSMMIIDQPEPLIARERRRGSERVLCVFNIGREDATVDLPADALGAPLEGHGLGWTIEGGQVHLPPDGGYFGKR
jgi:alpha-glucosidase